MPEVGEFDEEGDQMGHRVVLESFLKVIGKHHPKDQAEMGKKGQNSQKI
jgi:hypothetical protein